MQGNLSEIDIRSILQLIELGQRTGQLFVKAHPTGQQSKGASWFVFFLNGQIVYATEGTNNLSRLRDYLRRYQIEGALDTLKLPAIAATNAPEHGYLWSLLETKVLTPEQARRIIRGVVQETLFDLLSLHQGSFIFEVGPALEPQLTTLEVGSIVAKIAKQVQEWKQFHPHIQSPQQRPILIDFEQLQANLPPQTFSILCRWADGKNDLRQIARFLNRDLLTVAKAIFPLVQQGLIQLPYPEPPLVESSQSPVPRIVCIDDDMTVGKTIEYLLDRYGYHVTSINEPLDALGLVFRTKPDLILCDIAMPEPDGYEICAMLRQTSAFRRTPIVMLTGMDGFIDRVKARLVGSSDYLTKPFGEQELVMLVEKYVGSADGEHQALRFSQMS